MSKEVTPLDFLKPDFNSPNKKYLPYDEEPEVLEAINEAQREAWREIYAFGHLINREGRKWNETDIENLGSRLAVNGDKIRAAFKKIFEQNQDAFGITLKPEIYKVEYFLKKNWDFIRNEVTQRSEYKIRGQDEFIKVNLDTIWRTLQHAGFKFAMEKLKSLVRSDFMKSYNPFIEYFTNLPAWDYETDYIGQLANYIDAEDQAFHVTQFRKMLVRSIGCSLYGIENRFVYTFVGEKQNTGKSTFIRFLNPFGLRYYTEAPIRDKPDTYFAFAENFIYNLEELTAASNIEVNHLKAIISTAMIKERKPYAIDNEEQPRRCNFWASSNKDEFLIDSENTRWLCIRINGVDWAYKKEVDIHKVWAQAFALYNDSEYNQYLTQEEANHRDKMNKEFEITDIEKDLIKQCFEVADEATGTFYSNPDILNILNEKFNGKSLNSKFIGKNMKQLGFLAGSQYINKHKARGWYVQLRTTTLYSKSDVIASEVEIVPPAVVETQIEMKLPFDK